MLAALISVDLHILTVLSLVNFLGSRSEVSRYVSAVGLHARFDGGTPALICRVVLVLILVRIWRVLAMIDDHGAVLEAIKVDPWHVLGILRALSWGLALRFPPDVSDAGIILGADLNVLLVDEACRSCIFNHHVSPDAIRAHSTFHDEGPAGMILTDRPHSLMLNTRL